MIRLEQENVRLESKEVAFEGLISAQQQQILQLEQEVLANQRKSELLAEARQQNHQLEEKLKKVQLESEAKSKEIDEIQAELLLLRKYQEDLDPRRRSVTITRSSWPRCGRTAWRCGGRA